MQGNNGSFHSARKRSQENPGEGAWSRGVERRERAKKEEKTRGTEAEKKGRGPPGIRVRKGGGGVRAEGVSKTGLWGETDTGHE